jgi:8-oxo-dGTP diphosphatase
MPVSDQGANLPRYSLIPRTLIFVTRGDEVLLLKGAPTKRLWANRYNGVGGHIEAGEDALSAAHRELFEETGLRVELLRLAGVVFVDTRRNPGIGIYVITGEYTGGELVPSAEGALEWVSSRELGSYPLVEDLTTLVPLILKMKPGDPPFSAQYTYDQDEKLVIRFG